YNKIILITTNVQFLLIKESLTTFRYPTVYFLLIQCTINLYSLPRCLVRNRPGNDKRLFMTLDTILQFSGKQSGKSHRTHMNLNLARYDSVLYTHYFLLNGASLCNLFKNSPIEVSFISQANKLLFVFSI